MIVGEKKFSLTMGITNYYYRKKVFEEYNFSRSY